MTSPVIGSNVAQPGHVVAAQDPADRPRRDAELGSEPVLTTAVLAASVEDRCSTSALVRVGIV